MSSKPITLTSAGHVDAARRAGTASAPTAIESFSATIAVRPGSRVEQLGGGGRAAVAVEVGVRDVPGGQRRGRARGPPARSPASRSVVVVSSRGPAITPIAVWPSR